MSAQPDYFSLLSLPRGFEVDAAALEKSYFDLQRQYHPDRFARKTPEERAQAMQVSVAANDAYHTLKSPLLRAKYLLQLEGIAADNLKADSATLMENMEMQEALAEGGDLAALAGQAQKVEQECMQALHEACREADWQRAAQAALRLGYVSKLNEQIRQRKFAQEKAG